MKNEFISTVSHELRTPMTSVLGFTKNAQSRLRTWVFPHVPESEARARKAVRQVDENLHEGERLTGLLNDYLDITKMESGRMQWRMATVDVADLVQRVVNAGAALFPSAQPAFVHHVDPDLPPVRGDIDRLVQVLLNLISNAAKFTEQGEVALRAEAVTHGVALSVTDTGGGIDPADHQVIFKKFGQAADGHAGRSGGTGLGLPICQQIVRGHGSEIAVHSALGEGACFRFVLAAEAT